ncbi:MAG: hypothetical protein IJS09_06255 [Treponema sp.]|nr:hypothetical protein [Treponema sp.]
MKKKIIKGFLIASLCIFGLCLGGCADATGLHNQNALQVTFKFINFAEALSDGDYSIAGDFNGDNIWEATNAAKNISIKNGTGTSSTVYSVTSTWIKCSLVKTNDSAWTRPWYPTIKGNVVDEGTAGTPQQNFYLGGIDVNAGEAVIVIDGSKSGTDAMIYVQ